MNATEYARLEEELEEAREEAKSLGLKIELAELGGTAQRMTVWLVGSIGIPSLVSYFMRDQPKHKVDDDQMFAANTVEEIRTFLFGFSLGKESERRRLGNGDYRITV